MRLRHGWMVMWWVLVVGPMAARAESSASASTTNLTPDNAAATAPAGVAIEDMLRDPFWPPGYSPVTKTVPTAVSPPPPSDTSGTEPVIEDMVTRALSMLRIGGIIRRGPKCYASVNGIMVEAGDTIPVMVDGNLVVFTVRSVDMRRIRIEPLKK